MKKGLFSFLFNRDRDEEEAEQEDELRIIYTTPKVVICSGCGAENEIEDDCACEYCGAPLIYVEDDEESSTAAVKAPDAPGASQDLSQVPDTYTLSTGFYTAGIDIPAGKCDITAVSGAGFLQDSELEMDEEFGVEKGYVSSFKGLKLPRGVSLIVSEKLTVQVVYKSVQSGFAGRTYDMSRAMELSTGNYEAGDDFKAGTYNIVAVSGSGGINVGEGSVNEIFGLDEEDVEEIKHVDMPKGTELAVEGDLVVRLIPAVVRGSGN